MKFSFGRYCFAPTWLPTVATLLILPILIFLGCWQLSRAHEKQVLQDTYNARTKAEPINFNQLNVLPADLRFSAVKVTGRFDNTHVFLLDNKFFDHQLGYQVISPFILSNTKKIVLINRGWVAQNNGRKQLPSIQAVDGEITLQGIINVPEKAFSLGANLEDKAWPRVVQSVDFNQMAETLKQKVYPVVLLLAADQPYGFARDWQPFNGKVMTHYGYAFQWFALALTLIIIFIVVNTHRIKYHDNNTTST
jgi:surfeit locus 1 family protein